MYDHKNGWLGKDTDAELKSLLYFFQVCHHERSIKTFPHCLSHTALSSVTFADQISRFPLLQHLLPYPHQISVRQRVLLETIDYLCKHRGSNLIVTDAWNRRYKPQQPRP